MRLIDADKLIQEFEKNIETYESNEYEEGINTGIRWCTEDVANVPTVKAIPIEWLKNKSKDLADAYWNNVKNKLVLDMKDLPLVMDEIVRMWEKENETE